MPHDYCLLLEFLSLIEGRHQWPVPSLSPEAWPLPHPTFSRVPPRDPTSAGSPSSSPSLFSFGLHADPSPHFLHKAPGGRYNFTHVDTEPHRQVLLGTMSSVPEQRTSEGFLSGQNTGSRGGKLQPLPLFLVFRGPWSWFTKNMQIMIC